MHLLNSQLNSLVFCLALLAAGASGFVIGEEPQILKVSSEEAVASDYSHQRAVDFWIARPWRGQTNTSVLPVIPTLLISSQFQSLSSDLSIFQKVRNSLNELVQTRWQEKGPRWDAEIVMAAMTLTLVDRNLGEPLSQNAILALDKMWQVQQPDGGFDWLKCDWPPMESDDQYGAVVAAVAVSAAPQTYLRQQQVQNGIANLEDYLSKSRKQELRLHHRANSVVGSVTETRLDDSAGDRFHGCRIDCTAAARWWLEYTFSRQVG